MVMGLSKKLALSLFVSCLLVSTDLLAAPYCTVFSWGTQCWYYSYQSCVEAAGTQGACIINQSEVKPPPAASGAPFCVVASYGTQCWYYDAQSCQEAAASADGVCAVNPNAGPPK